MSQNPPGLQVVPMRQMLAWMAVLVFTGSAYGQGTQNTLAELLAEFQSEPVFWRQFEVGEQIASLGDASALSELEPYLRYEDRHIRGNAAYVFARLGNVRGYETLTEISVDRSSRSLGQGHAVAVQPCPAGGRCDHVSIAQIRTDRYYAVHLFGELGDPRGVDVLIPLLTDESINYKAAWALGEIGDPRAVQPLIAALGDPDALMRVSAIQALEKLRATEALRYLRQLLNDDALPKAGDQVPVSETARKAIATLEEEP